MATAAQPITDNLERTPPNACAAVLPFSHGFERVELERLENRAREKNAERDTPWDGRASAVPEDLPRVAQNVSSFVLRGFEAADGPRQP